jgi:hypothetical protein
MRSSRGPANTSAATTRELADVVTADMIRGWVEVVP